MTDFESTNIFKVGKFLKDRPNNKFTISDLSKNLKIPKKSVSSSLSRLKHGRNVTKLVDGRKRIQLKKNGKPRKRGYKGFKIGKIRNEERGMWEYFEVTDYKFWKVDFKLKETNESRKNKKKYHAWTGVKDGGKMDLSAWATGLVPADVKKSAVIEIAGHELFRASLDVMNDEGVFLWQSVNEDDSKIVVIGATLENENPLDENYNPTWDGKINFINNIGVAYEYNVSFDIEVDEY